MAEEVRIWQVDEADALKEIERFKLDREERIEKWISSDVSLLSQDLLIIGEQVETASGNFIDLLCIDRSGNLVILELKRDKTPREVTAQALDYASWVKELDAKAIDAIAAQYLDGETLEAAFQSKFGIDLPGVINEHHAMRVVASEIDDSTERIIHYLAETYGVDINAIRFQFFQAQDGREFLVRTFTVPPEVVEQKSRDRKSTGVITRMDFFGKLDPNGKAVFESVLEFAEERKMPIHWGIKGFSLNTDLDGTHVTVFFCFPPGSVFKQSIYTNLMHHGIGIATKTEVPDDEIRRLWSEAQATGLFRPAGQELRCSIDRAFTDAEVGKVLAWCEGVAASIAKYGLKEVGTLKHVRYLPKDDEAGRLRLEKLGYVFRGISKKGSQVFVLPEVAPTVDEETADAIDTTFGLERDLQSASR